MFDVTLCGRLIGLARLSLLVQLIAVSRFLAPFGATSAGLSVDETRPMASEAELDTLYADAEPLRSIVRFLHEAGDLARSDHPGLKAVW